ncbi:hypothetical protein G4B88_009141 [Cannabis sativa]|uniref:Uncharacterized protein n=1 Tax=Cannabis sativa TaxID=3483 RepID=A0A7J6DMS6_CANSA|nr:hypothetical protein G4B88_009141 [Cannabis sativa]
MATIVDMIKSFLTHNSHFGLVFDKEEHLTTLDIGNLDPLAKTFGQENNIFHLAIKCAANPEQHL